MLLLQLTSVLAAQCAAVAHIQRMTAGSGWDLQAQADAQAALQLRYGLNSDAQQQLALKLVSDRVWAKYHRYSWCLMGLHTPLIN